MTLIVAKVGLVPLEPLPDHDHLIPTIPESVFNPIGSFV